MRFDYCDGTNTRLLQLSLAESRPEAQPTAEFAVPVAAYLWHRSKAQAFELSRAEDGLEHTTAAVAVRHCKLPWLACSLLLRHLRHSSSWLELQQCALARAATTRFQHLNAFARCTLAFEQRVVVFRCSASTTAVLVHALSAERQTKT